MQEMRKLIGKLNKIYNTVDIGNKYRLTIRYFYDKTKTVDCVIFRKQQHDELMYSLFCVYGDGTGGYEWIRPDYKYMIDRNVIKVKRIK